LGALHGGMPLATRRRCTPQHGALFHRPLCMHGVPPTTVACAGCMYISISRREQRSGAGGVAHGPVARVLALPHPLASHGAVHEPLLHPQHRDRFEWLYCRCAALTCMMHVRRGSSQGGNSTKVLNTCFFFRICKVLHRQGKNLETSRNKRSIHATVNGESQSEQ
jgi:hypothetical protein